MVALEGGTVGWSVLALRVFPRIRLRASGSTSIGSSALGPGGLVAVLSPGTSGLSIGGSSCPVMSSYKKSPSCSCRSPSFLMCSVMKRSHLRSCTLDYGTVVGNLHCRQRVADDNTWVPKSICWLLGCICSTSPEPEALSNM